MHHHNQYKTPIKPSSPVKTIKRLLSFLSSRKKTIFLLFIPIILSVLLGLVWPKVLGDVIDIIKTNIDAVQFPYKSITVKLSIGFSAFLLAQLCTFTIGYATTIISNKTIKELRHHLFSHIQSLPVKEFTESTHGEFMSRLTNDIDMVANTVGQGITRFFETVLMLVATLSYMFIISSSLTVVALLTLPITVFLSRFIALTSRKLFRSRQQCLGEINGLVEEVFTGQKTVIAFSREKHFTDEFSDKALRLKDIAIKAETIGGFMGPCMNLVNNLNFLVVAAVGGYLASQNSISIGTIVTFILFSRNFSRPINELANQFNEIQSSIAGAERVFNILDIKEENKNESSTVDISNIKGKITFDNVCFGYTDEKLVIKDFSATFNPGEKIALIGETGSGKTTIASLISKFYDIKSGDIYIDNININDLSLKDLRSLTALVLQDTHLFTGTIRENICFGTSNASEVDIKNAAKLANADIFIEKLPEKYDTIINQADTSLSQGQCQLLAIARAALTNPKILILDEATSNVDTRTEKHIQEAMVRLMHGRTSIIIAHRLSTIRDADKILVLKNGKIAEQGNHDELIKQDSIYKKMINAK